jgi:hypothetical protein
MTQVNQFNINELRQLFQRKGYVWYEDGKLNIIGVRNSIPGKLNTNSFNDWILVIYNNAGRYEYYQYAATTDPGLTYSLAGRGPEDLRGVSQLIPGQYVNVYKIDLHRGQYEALCQRNGKVKIWRDGNKNNILDNSGPGVIVEESNDLGINIHRANASGTTLAVNNYSAGCQVFKTAGDFYQFMNIVRSKRTLHRELFTYTLLESVELTQVPPSQNAVIPASTLYSRADGAAVPRLSTRRSRSTTTTNITPYISSIESFHPNIQYELTRRRLAGNTIHSHTPFVKLTSLMYVSGSNLLSGQHKSAWCPTLGVHDRQDLKFEDIYLGQGTSKRSIVGYATSTTGRVPIVVTEEDVQLDQPNIPPPGITSIITERSTTGPMGVRGGLFKATIKITAYSVGQLNALMKYFMRPATRVVLEYGRLASDQNPEDIEPYNWTFDKQGNIRTDSSVINDSEDGFKKLITLESSQTAFIEKYVYRNNGNYEIFIGYVVKFGLKYGKNNTYEIELTVHSVQQFEIPSKYTGAKPLCRTGTSVSDPECKVTDVHEYFDDAASRKTNSLQYLLTKVITDDSSEISKEWISHVVPIATTNATDGGNQSTGANNPDAGTGIGGYFVSWKFFVNVILNDKNYGLMSLFGNNSVENETYLRSNFIKPLGDRGTQPSSDRNLLLADEVAYNPALRSTNPGVMLIYNSGQQELYDATFEYVNVLAEAVRRAEQTGTTPPTNFSDSSIFGKIVGNQDVGDFKSDGDTSFLSNGVWINTNAIKQAFTAADTVSAGISNLLGYMNASVSGYWNLQLISNDTSRPGMHVIDTLPKFPENTQTVSDLDAMDESSITRTDDPKLQLEGFTGEKKTIQVSSTESIQINRPKYLYMFNRKTKQLTDDDLGSELLDINISFDLPQVIAVQAIANIGGVAQRGTINAIDINELQSLSLIPEIYATCSAATTTGTCPDDVRVEVTAASLNPPTQRPEFLGGAAPSPSATLLTTGFSPFSGGFGSTEALTTQFEERTATAKALVTQNPNGVAAVREYGYLGQAIQLIELNPPKMLKALDSNSGGTGTRDKVHPFNSSNLTKSIVDLTMPGIGGIQLFQTFAVDRVPQILKRGVYIVTKIVHEFNLQTGWITKVQGRFRYRPQNEE